MGGNPKHHPPTSNSRSKGGGGWHETIFLTYNFSEQPAQCHFWNLIFLLLPLQIESFPLTGSVWAVTAGIWRPELWGQGPWLCKPCPPHAWPPLLHLPTSCWVFSWSFCSFLLSLALIGWNLCREFHTCQEAQQALGLDVSLITQRVGVYSDLSFCCSTKLNLMPWEAYMLSVHLSSQGAQLSVHLLHNGVSCSAWVIPVSGRAELS